jgi:CRP-like cAMP-binding protein
MKLLETYLSEFSLDKELIALLMTKAHKFKVAKDERLLSPTNLSDRMYYLTSGVVREYEIFETERTYWLSTGGNWFFSAESYITGNPSLRYIQALEEAEGYYFHKYELEEMLQLHAPLAFLAYKLTQDYILKIEERNSILHINPLAKRLEYFEEKQPQPSTGGTDKIESSCDLLTRKT